MNIRCPPASLSATAAPVKAPAASGLLASLQTLINQPGLTSVDLVDTIFATLPRRDGAPYEAVVRPNCSE
jgi:hypothetical protein